MIWFDVVALLSLTVLSAESLGQGAGLIHIARARAKSVKA